MAGHHKALMKKWQTLSNWCPKRKIRHVPTDIIRFIRGKTAKISPLAYHTRQRNHAPFVRVLIYNLSSKLRDPVGFSAMFEMLAKVGLDCALRTN